MTIFDTMNEITLSYDEMLDRVESQMIEIGESEFETSGFLVGGMYVRSIFIPAGSFLTSKVHRSDHPFILSAGSIVIYTEDGGEQVLHAPYIDITKAGTRRFAKALTDCLWTCIHRIDKTTDKTTEKEIEDEVIIKRNNPLLKEMEASH